jgi:hypothetical protein
MPERIQRKRTKGWRMPEGAVYVGRPSKWGNPFTVDTAIELGYATTREDAQAFSVECFEDWITRGRFGDWWFGNGGERYEFIARRVADDLYGKDLACWCPIGTPCHADVLLRLATGMPYRPLAVSDA